jgi:tetratricopeptide (TPR) repeat protein
MKNVNSSDVKSLSVDKIVGWIYDNLKILGGIVGTLVVVAVGAFFYLQSQHKSESEASDTLFVVENKYQDIVKSVKKQPNAGLDNPMFQIPPSESEKAEINSKAAPVLQEWLTAIEAYKNRKASWAHAIKLAGIYFDNKDYVSAEKVLSSVKAEVSAGEPFFGLIRHGLGLARLGQQKYNDAITDFDEILKNNKQEFIFPSALYQKALAQKSAGDLNGSSETLQKLRRDFPNTSAAEMSQSQLFLLKAMSWKEDVKAK